MTNVGPLVGGVGGFTSCQQQRRIKLWQCSHVAVALDLLAGLVPALLLVRT